MNARVLSCCVASVVSMASVARAAEAEAEKKPVYCSKVTLLAGNPTHGEPQERPKDGTGLLEDPPLPYRQVVFSKGQLISHTGSEIWRADLKDQKLHKVAGTEGGMALVSGPCAKARFGNIAHLAVASDGALYVSDQTANAILKVVDPLGAGCTVVRWAGAPKDVESLSPSSRPNAGNVDGPGDKAKLATPQRLALDGKDNLYFWDEDNNSIRKVSNDAAHTVSTFVSKLTENSGALLSQTFLGGKLYVYGTDGSEVFLSAFDTEGKKTSVFKGRADLFGYDSSSSKTLGGMTNDGSSLILFFNGQLFRVTPAGVISPIAGVEGNKTDPSSGYDFKAPHPGQKAELLFKNQNSTAGMSVFLGTDAASKVYVSGRFANSYVLKLDCAP